ncbi:MAG: hypothetical protein ACK4IX_07770, partial [Candidatus Sericytochromatia bacterium]
EFGKVNNALKRMSERLRRGGSGRRNSETASSQEELRQKNASTQAALSSRSKQRDNEDEDMETDSDGGDSNLSGGGSDQESTIMMLKSMYGNEEAPKLEEIANELPDNTLDNSTKSKVAKGFSNSEISPKSDESISLVETLDSEKFKSLETSTKSVVTTFIEQEKPLDTSLQKIELPDPNQVIKSTVDDISITSKEKTSGNLTISEKTLSTTSDDVTVKVKVVSTKDSNGNQKMINDPIFGSSINITTKSQVLKEQLKSALLAIAKKVLSTDVSVNNMYSNNVSHSTSSSAYHDPNIGIICNSLEKMSTIMLDPNLDKPLSIRIPISFDESGNTILEKAHQKLDNAYMSEGGAYVFYEK